MPGCPVRLAGNRPPSVGGCRLLLHCDWTTRPYGGITRIKLTVEASLPLSLAAPVRLRLHHSPDRVTSRPAAGLRGLSKSLELVMIVVTKRQGMMMARCARCGNEIPAGSVFCTYCGIPVASGAAAAPGSGAQMPQPGTAASGFAPNTVPGTGTLPPVPQPAGPADNGGSAPQGQPGSQSQPGKKPPLTPAQRKKRKIIIAIIAAIVVVAIVVGGVAAFLILHGKKNAAAGPVQTSDTTDATPKKTQKQSPTQIEGKKAVSEVTMTNFVCNYDTSDWGWDGGAVLSDVMPCANGDASSSSDSDYGSSSQSADDGQYAFGVWTPAMDESKVIYFSALKSGEKMYSDPVVAATYGPNPSVFVIYAVKTKAVGTTPETVHLFAHQVDLKSGELSDRIDLRTEEDNLINLQQDYEFDVLAQSNNRVAIEKSWKTTEKRTVNDDQREVEIGHKQIMGLSGGAKQAETLQTFKDSVSISKDSGGYQSLNTTEVDVDDYHVFDTYVVKDSAYHLYSIDGNKEIVKIPSDYCSPGDTYRCDLQGLYRFGANQYVLNPSESYNGNKLLILDAGTGKTKKVTDLLNINTKDDQYVNFTDFGQFSDGSLYFQWDESSDSKRVFILSRDLKVTEVLDGGRWARLMLNSGEFEGANYLLKQFYVKTTDENIIVDEKGETVGSYTLTPSGDDADDYDHTAVDWIMWRDGSENTVTVTRGQAPGEPAPDSSDGSGSSSGDGSAGDSSSGD